MHLRSICSAPVSYVGTLRHFDDDAAKPIVGRLEARTVTEFGKNGASCPFHPRDSHRNLDLLALLARSENKKSRRISDY